MEDKHQIPQLSATTLLILEREDEECQVFVLKRQNRGGFLQDAVVFPGGVVEGVDYEHNDPFKAAAVRELLEETGLIISEADLWPFSWWMTPKVEKRRFNTRFFVALYPRGQLPQINIEESQWGELLTPREILARHAIGDFRLMPPTLLSLEQICGLKSFAEILSKSQDLSEPICPNLESRDGEAFLALPEGHRSTRLGFKISSDGRFS